MLMLIHSNPTVLQHILNDSDNVQFVFGLFQRGGNSTVRSVIKATSINDMNGVDEIIGTTVRITQNYLTLSSKEDLLQGCWSRLH